MADNDALSPWEHALAIGITAATWRATHLGRKAALTVESRPPGTL
jgi:hypothetical protein